jgi:putative ABC transport system ATP-binding protein
MVFQSYALFPHMSVIENVSYGLRQSQLSRQSQRDKAREGLKMVGLEGYDDQLPSELSGGQQQRVAVARALINNPDILLCDEPTGNLDSKTGAGIMDLMTDLNRKGTTIIMVTHDPHIAEYSQRTIRIADGRIVS